MNIQKLKPECKGYIWGGETLKKEFGKAYDGKLAETWELAVHKNGNSFIVGGEYDGVTLGEYINAKGKQILGSKCDKYEEFPILIKLIDANDNLSIQVHPDDEYAKLNENSQGKTEVWYIVDAEEDAYIYYGFNKNITKEEMAQRIGNNTILDVLNKVDVKKGDVFFIEAGTIHAICKGIVVAEIQQSSDITYRVYDYNRTANGVPRELHIQKAVDVTNTNVNDKKYDFHGHLCDCEYFVVDKIVGSGDAIAFETTDSFCNILVLDGSGVITHNGVNIPFNKGDSLFVECNVSDATLLGEFECIVSRVK